MIGDPIREVESMGRTGFTHSLIFCYSLFFSSVTSFYFVVSMIPPWYIYSASVRIRECFV